jgi:DNA-binding LacI/PurR family transcriptional regulator
LEGYRGTLRAAGIEPSSDLIWMENVSPTDSEEEASEIGRVAALSLLNRKDPPTAFFAINDMTAIGIYAGIRELGLRVPQDISVIGFDDIHLCRVMNPPITTVRQPLEQLMKSAVGLLIGRMEGKQDGEVENITMVPELMVRGSTGAVRE